MSAKIFLIDPDPTVTEDMFQRLVGAHEVVRSAPAEMSRLLAAEAGDAVVCGGPGVAFDAHFWSELRSVAPRARRIVCTDSSDFDALQRIVESAEPSRLLAWPRDVQQLSRAIEAITSSERPQAGGRDLLWSFARELSTAQSLSDIARLSCETIHAACGGNSVFVQLWVPDPESFEVGRVEAEAGGEMSGDMHLIELADDGTRVGEIVVDRAGEWPPIAAEVLARIETPLTTAVAALVRREERDAAIHRAMMAVARLAGRREHTDGWHIDRMSRFVRLIAEGLEADGHYTAAFTGSFVEDLVRAVPLHDIGKLAVPDAILLKPAQLSPEERVIVEQHAEIGARTIEEAMSSAPHSFLSVAHAAALGHHEKWDGSGYPHRKAGEDIPLAARIYALADIYDALTTRRPYRDAWTHERALEWISEAAGAHLDPLVVASFLLRAEQADGIRLRFRDNEERGAPLAA